MELSNPENISILDFSYELPDSKIAKYPLAERDESKLLIYNNGSISESQYVHLPELLPTDALLVFNNTKVVNARIHFTKSTGAHIEIFCLEPVDEYADITTAMLQKQKVHWQCLVGGAKKWKEPLLTKEIVTSYDSFLLHASIIEKRNDYFIIEFSWTKPDLCFAEVLHFAGIIPLPPYLNRNSEAADESTYQTIYAKHDGSVAAPTAGLHFTERLFNKLADKKIEHQFVTLHVGAGTFKPVKAATMKEHEMHAEFIDVSIEFLQHLLRHTNKQVFPVGTTSLRTLESIYWIAIKLMNNENDGQVPILQQWDAYRLPQHISVIDALAALVSWMQKHHHHQLITKTELLIAPGYRFRIAKGLITNFHQPQSTLLLLVAAMIGDDWKRVYQYALENNFRFLSYGDGSLLFANQ